MPVPKFGFLRKVGKFINRTANRILGRADVAAQAEKLVRLATAEYLTPLAVSLSEGSMSLPAWQTEMRQTIKRLYVNQYTLARGGKAQMTFQDYGGLSQMLQDQYKYLDKYAAQLATMDVAEREAYIRNRSQLYANASNEAFERGKAAVAQSLGFDEVTWHLSPVEHCQTCKDRDAIGTTAVSPRGGWMDPEVGETWPADGTTLCITNCRCFLSYSNSETGDVWEEAAGPGRGWWGPPVGTHGAGSVGGAGFTQVSSGDFVQARDKNVPDKYRPFVTGYSGAEYDEMGARLFMTGKTGFAIKPDGDIISVFSSDGKGKLAIADATRRGGTKLDCFDGYLARDLYPAFGFKEYNRLGWNDKYAPVGWNTKKFDHPDLVFLQREGGSNAGH